MDLNTEKELMVRIFWKSKITGNFGNGSEYMPIKTTKEEIKRLNKEFPELIHWYE